MNRKRIQTTLAAGALALAAALTPRSAPAEESSWKTVSYITKFDAKPVGDVEGHFTGSWERRGLCLYPNGEVGVSLGSGTLDLTKGKGTIQGESTCTFEDGSSISTTYTMSVESGPKGLSAYSDGKGKYVGGTGRYQGIQGNFSFKGRSYTPFKGETKGDAVAENEGRYTLSAK